MRFTISPRVVATMCVLVAVGALSDRLRAQDPVRPVQAGQGRAGQVVTQDGGGPIVPTPGNRPQMQTPPPPLNYVGLDATRTLEYIQAAQQHLNYLPGEVLVKFKTGVAPDGEQQALLALRSRPDVSALRWAGNVAMLHDDTQPNAEILADQLRSQPEVEFAEPDYLLKLPHLVGRAGSVLTGTGSTSAVAQPFFTPNDPDFNLQWNFTLIDMPDAWNINAGGSTATIAIVDTGVTTTNQTVSVKTWNGSAIVNYSAVYGVNPDMSSSRFVSPYDFVTGMGTAVFDSDGHGTHVASTAGESTNNGLGEAGIAYAAQIMPVKVCTSYWDVQYSMSQNGIPGAAPLDAGGCPDSAIAQGIQWAADHGANVLNLSLGGPGQSSTILSALQYAIGKGVFIAMAAGNDYQNGNPAEYPAAYGPQLAGAVAVGAVNMASQRAYYSSTGSYLELAAPGGDDTDPSNSASGWIWQSTLCPSTSDPFETSSPNFSTYCLVAYEGTSMATPHVVGSAALVVSQTKGKITPAQLESLLEATAKDLGTPGKDSQFGFGLVQPRLALRGYGLIK